MQFSPYVVENVCLTLNEDNSIYAIGSIAHVQLFDASNTRQLVSPVYIDKDIGKFSIYFVTK